MTALVKSRAGIAIVAAFLVLQLAFLWLVMSGHLEFSIFCLGDGSMNNDSISSLLPLFFFLIHLLLLGLLVLGFVSLHFSKLRLPYISLLAAALLTLPGEAWLVHHYHLSCGFI